jgi:hypothetical protein
MSEFCGAAGAIDLCTTINGLAAGGVAVPGVTPLVGKDCKTYTIPASVGGSVSILAPPAGYVGVGDLLTGSLVTGIRVTDEFSAPNTSGVVVDDGTGVSSIQVWRNYVRTVRSSIGAFGASPVTAINNPSNKFAWQFAATGWGYADFNVPHGSRVLIQYQITVNGGGVAPNVQFGYQNNSFIAGSDNERVRSTENWAGTSGVSAALTLNGQLDWANSVGAANAVANPAQSLIVIAGSAG